MLDINILKDSYEDFLKYDEARRTFELNGEFFIDQDPVDPNSYDPVTLDFPFIRKGFSSWVQGKIYNGAYAKYAKKANALTNLKVEGKENLKGIKGAIVTCNHVSKVDNFAVREALGEPFMFIAAEFNNWKGEMGEIARNTGYIPLPSNLNIKIMRKFNEAVEYYLNKNKKILIYPEQAMWREYTKPRPMQNGAFHYAVINNVPVLPLFITIKEKDNYADEMGRANFGDYTIHILPPIYPQEGFSTKENENYMKLENFRLWKECYERTYSTPLTYTTKPEIWEEKFAEYTPFVTLTTKRKKSTRTTKTSNSKTSKSTSAKTTSLKTNKSTTTPISNKTESKPKAKSKSTTSPSAKSTTTKPTNKTMQSTKQKTPKSAEIKSKQTATMAPKNVSKTTSVSKNKQQTKSTKPTQPAKSNSNKSAHTKTETKNKTNKSALSKSNLSTSKSSTTKK